LVKTTHISALSEELNSLHLSIGEQSEVINVLLSKLSEVTLPSAPTAVESDSAAGYPPSSIAVIAVRSAREKLEQQTQVLHDLIKRQQVG